MGVNNLPRAAAAPPPGVELAMIVEVRRPIALRHRATHHYCKGKGKSSPYSIAERRVPELIPVLGSQPAGDVSHKPGGRLPGLQLPPQPLRGLLPILLLIEQRHEGREQFA